jgi:hypothetical protein
MVRPAVRRTVKPDEEDPENMDSMTNEELHEHNLRMLQRVRSSVVDLILKANISPG